MNAATLPAPLAEPLHLLQPSPWPDRLAILLVVLLAALVGRWLLRRRRPAPRPVEAAPAVTSAPIAEPRTVEAIRQRFDVRGRYRSGCHALAAAVRRHLGDRGHPSTTWTARDIVRRVDDPALGQLAQRLANARFGRREPARREFHSLCDLTESTLARAAATSSRTSRDADAGGGER